MLLTLKIIHKFSRLVLLSIPFESSAFFFILSSSTKIIAKKKKERKNRNYFFEYWVKRSSLLSRIPNPP